MRVDRGSTTSFYDLNTLSKLMLPLEKARLRRKYLTLACNYGTIRNSGLMITTERYKFYGMCILGPKMPRPHDQSFYPSIPGPVTCARDARKGLVELFHLMYSST